MSDNLYHQFFARFGGDLARSAIERPGAATLTYGDLDAGSARVANLFASLDIGSGDRVALQVEKSAEALLVYLATIRIGAVYLPLNPAYTAREVEYFLSDARPSLFVCKPSDEAAAGALATRCGVPHVLTLGVEGDGSLPAAAADRSDAFETVALDGRSLAAILYTSGTTGRSKGAMLTHANLGSNAATLQALWRFEASDRLLHALPIFHTHGLFVATNVTMMAASAMVLLPRFDVDALIRHLPDATVLMGVPTFYSRLLAHPGFDADVARNIRLFVSGSAPLSAETHRAFTGRTGNPILERYGMTETNMNTSNPYEGPRIPGSVGLPLPGVEVRIADPQEGETAAERVGMIEVRGPNVFEGYWEMPDKTAEDIRADGFFRTGDLGYFDDMGYLHISGRDKDLIISGGFNIYPAEIETLIDELPGVAESAVVGVPHPDMGEGVIAVVAPKVGAQLDADALRTALGDTLAAYKRPRRFVVLDELPRNAMGKVQKAVLRERLVDTFAGGDTGG